MVVAVLIATSVIVDGTGEQEKETDGTKARDFEEIKRGTSAHELFPRVCGMHSWKCGRRRSAAHKVNLIHDNI